MTRFVRRTIAVSEVIGGMMLTTSFSLNHANLAGAGPH